MATTFNLISSVTVGSGGAANIEFTSIPATYTDLVLLLSLRSNRSATQSAVALQFNNSSTTYGYRRLYASGSTAGSDTDSAQSSTLLGEMNAATSTANCFSNKFIYIPNYASSNYKSASTDNAIETNNTTTNRISFTANLWSNSSAITSIKLFDQDDGSALIVQYSTAYLYGISNA